MALCAAALFAAAAVALPLVAAGPARAGNAAAAPDALRDALAAAGKEVAINGNPVPLAPVRAFYAGRNHSPAWTGAAGLDGRGRSLMVLIAGAAHREGLEPADYALPAHPEGQPAGLDIRVSATLLRYAIDVGAGRIGPRKVDAELFVYDDGGIDGASVLRRAAVDGDLRAFLDALAPASADYLALRQALARHREIAAAGALQPVGGAPGSAPGKAGTLTPGDTPADPGVLARLAARLRASGDLRVVEAGGDGAGSGPQTYGVPGTPETYGVPGTPETYGGALVGAVLRFQKRHGLAPDGVVGPRTRAALEVPVTARILQIQLNMERWRWLVDSRGDPHVIVNLAAFELTAVRGGVPQLKMRVVVGRPYRRSPVFSDRISYIELNPHWNVPYSIATKDLLPKAKQDPAFLVAQGFEVTPTGGVPGRESVSLWSVDWQSYGRSRFPFTLRQKPGPQNALGRIKFMFPNEHAVYLHDTPARGLFRQTVRTFSSGCIRVAKPLRLAEFLLGPEWQPERVRAEIESGNSRILRVEPPVPVHLAYQTAWVGTGGTMNFRDDVYGHDARLAEALVGR